jgi:hypothetical protein
MARLGEMQFETLCVAAGPMCSKPTPDREGIDYLVTFPSKALDAFVLYDKRPAPVQIAVQVETVTSPRPSRRSQSGELRATDEDRYAVDYLLAPL